MSSKNLKKLRRRYSRVCDELDQLNEEANELENEIMWASSEEAKP